MIFVLIGHAAVRTRKEAIHHPFLARTRSALHDGLRANTR